MGYFTIMGNTVLLYNNLKKCHTTENIARHEIPDWCQHPQRGPPAAAASGINLIYPHCPPNGEATTLDVACYPPPGGPVNGGPDILPTKRQTVVDRLRRRLEAYRRHQGSCQPRYDQSANGQYDIQRQETLQLKQRFLESKAKKTRRNDHGRNSGASANGNDPSQKNSNTPKLKRQAASPLLDCATDNIDSQSTKRHCPDPCESFSNSVQQQQQVQHQAQQSQNPGLQSYSVQIVQQFASSSAPQTSHSQTIQTNSPVQCMNNGLLTASSSPLASTAGPSASPGCVASGSADSGNQLANPVPSTSGGITAASTSTNVECKPEPVVEYPQCSVNGTLPPLPELNNQLNSANNNVNTTTTSSTAATAGDRFSDSLANLGFPDDSGDAVFHPGLLQDLIDDVFTTTNPNDLMKGFNFVDNLGLKDSPEDEKDSLKPILGLNNKSLQDRPLSHFPDPSNNDNLFSMNPTQQNVFDFPSTEGNPSVASQTMPNNSNNVQSSFSSSRIGSYTATSPSMSGMANSGLGLDFKLTEPSPAAQTLKQMAEQHQNMQQKQQLGLGVSPRSPFGSETLSDALSNIRTNCLSRSPNSMNTLQNSPTGMYQPMGYPQQQQTYSAPSSSAVKQEIVTPNTPMYPPNMTQHISEMELHRRRQQAMQMQQNQMGNLAVPPFSHSPDQKRQYHGNRQLPMYNDPSPGHQPNDGGASASNSPVPHHSGQFLRSVSTPGVTPPPQGFVSSPSPSGGAMHPNQGLLMQHTATNQQQLQMAQSHLIINQDLKPVLSAQQQLQQHQQQLHMQQQMQARFYNSQSHLQHIPTSQTPLNFQYAGPTSSINSNINQRSSTTAQTNPIQRQQFYMTRPPPEYQASIEPNNTSISSLKSVLSQNAQMHNSINVCNDQSSRNMELRNFNASKSYSSMMPTTQILSESTCQSYSDIPSVSTAYPGATPISNTSNFSKPYQGMLPVSAAASKPFPNVITLDDSLESPNNKSYSDGILSNSTTSRPFAGLSQNSSAISMSKSLQDSISMSNASVLTGKSYPSNTSILNPLSVSLPKSFVDPSLNNMSTSKSYQRRMANSNLTASQPYAVSSGTLLGQSQMMPVTTVTSTYTSSRGRAGGKQVASKRSRQSGHYRQPKPPNVNVGPEGLNISQRPPVMNSEWRHTFAQQNQHFSNINTQLRMTLPRQPIQNFGQNVGNNYQSHHISSNLPASVNNSLMSNSSNSESILSRLSSIPEMNSGSTLQQSSQVVIAADNSMHCSSQLHMSTSIASPGESMNLSHQQVFSPGSSNGSSQNIVPDTLINLDFLDTIDCSTSDLLTFDENGSTTFSLLDDISMLDK